MTYSIYSGASHSRTIPGIKSGAMARGQQLLQAARIKILLTAGLQRASHSRVQLPFTKAAVKLTQLWSIFQEVSDVDAMLYQRTTWKGISNRAKKF